MRIEEVIEKYKPDFAFAYGSGVFRQEGYTNKNKPMIDFVFGVESSLEWHKQNLEKNKNDYSLFARVFGADFVNWLQEKGAGVYYNPYVKFKGEIIKYGVISIENLIKDLEEWTYLYVAGRLHKPVKILKSDEKVEISIRKNLEHAVNVSLFLLPERFSETELYETIAGISYIGESRGRFENPKKVKNIVSGNFEKFQEMYREILNSHEKINFSDGKFHQDTGILEAYKKLPENLKSMLPSIFTDSNEELQNNLRKAISKIVYSSSRAQTIKGFFSAGLSKSIKYAIEKIKKSRS